MGDRLGVAAQDAAAGQPVQEGGRVPPDHLTVGAVLQHHDHGVRGRSRRRHPGARRGRGEEAAVGAGGRAAPWWAAGALQPAVTTAAKPHAAAALRAVLTARRPARARLAVRGAARAAWAASGRALPADRLTVPVFGELAAVMHKEATRAGELVSLPGTHPHSPSPI